MEKEFGKYSLEELKQFVFVINEAPKFQKLFDGYLSSPEGEKFVNLFHDMHWVSAYEESLIKQGLKILGLVNHSEWFANLVQSKNPQGEAISYASFLSSQVGVDGYFDELLEDISIQKLAYILGLGISVLRSLESIRINGVSIQDLVANYKRTGNDEILFSAIQMDRSIAASSIALARISRAELLGDEKFFNKLRNALKGRPKKPWQAYGTLRFFLNMLHDDGILQNMGRQEQYNLFEAKLGIYSGDYKAYGEFARSWQKTKTS